MLNVVTAEVYSINLNILCSFLHILFFFQIAFSQHNSIMDLVQFFVTFFRWVSRRYTRWQLPQVRPPHPPEHRADPPHLLSGSRPLGDYVTPEGPVCAVVSLSTFTCAVIMCVTLRPLQTIASSQLQDVNDLQASTEGWCHPWRPSIMFRRESSALPWRLCVSHLSCSWAAALLTAALQLKTLRSSGLSVYFLPVLCNLKCMFFLC